MCSERLVSSESDADLGQDIFAGLGTTGKEHTNRIKLNAKPFALTATGRIPFLLYSPVKQELRQKEEQDLMRRSTRQTPWCRAATKYAWT